MCRLQISTERACKRIKWSRTRRLTPGNLIAISTARDNFHNICKVAVVSERCAIDGSPLIVHIQWANMSDAVFDPDEELVIVESRCGFFEAMRHALVGLQYSAGTESPLDKYLVDGNTAISLPRYVLDKSELDLTPLLNEAPDSQVTDLRNRFSNFPIIEGIPFDICPYTSLDVSQLEAVHRILTKELAIVQGPPGTGKTFTSVQAIRVLLDSQPAGDSPPIIVAAETNHAVDQILRILIGHGFRTLRLGSRTRDEDVKAHNLHNLRQQVSNQTGFNDRDYGTIERVRKAKGKEFSGQIEQALPQELLDPRTLMEHGLITEAQLASLLSHTWEDCEKAADEEEEETLLRDAMREWLGSSLVGVAPRSYQDPVFEHEEVYDVDLDELEIDFDDDVSPENMDKEGCLKGEFVPISRQYGGHDTQQLAYIETKMRKELKKRDLWQINTKNRGAIYEYWYKCLLKKQRETLIECLTEYHRITRNLKINRWFKDAKCIRTANIQVVGCTTTGLGKYRGLIAALKPRTMIVEEAAQSREAQVASALYGSLQQLVLVGDHQQMRPHCDTPGLGAWPYHLDVSMFERLVRYHRMPLTVLKKQRRMIPIIREILNPFYKELGDHPSVENRNNRPPIPGMPVESYLCQHQFSEDTDLELQSKFNLEEAQMVVKFFVYLVINGTPPEKITVLTFYRGQRKKILQLARRELAPLGIIKIGVYTVDSYQGEENDVILLSMVRSTRPNMRPSAGFVQDKNRGVVAISRARRGFYIFGNISHLECATQEASFMWGSVRQVMKRQDRCNAARSGLPIRCKNHNNLMYMDSPDSWIGNHGGCHQKCGGKFDDCGHDCGRQCHPMPHERLVCQKPCERSLPCGHACSQFCGDQCRCSRKCTASLGVDYAVPVNGEAPQKARSGTIRACVGRTSREDIVRGGRSTDYTSAIHGWCTFDATSDDARIRLEEAERKGASQPLISFDGTNDVQEVKIRDAFRQVTLSGPQEKRTEGAAVIREDVGALVAAGSNSGRRNGGRSKAYRNGGQQAGRGVSSAATMPGLSGSSSLGGMPASPTMTVAEWEEDDDVAGLSLGASASSGHEVEDLIDMA